MLNLFFTFFKIGLFTFGGGYAMLPLLRDEVVNKQGWASDEELLDYYSIGQCTPGIIAVNVATFVGYRHFGRLGGIIATLGIILPSLIIIMLIASVLEEYIHNEYLSHAFAGIRIAVVALILNTLADMWKKSLSSTPLWLGYTILSVALLALIFLQTSAIIIVIAAAFTGWLSGRLRSRRP